MAERAELGKVVYDSCTHGDENTVGLRLHDFVHQLDVFPVGMETVVGDEEGGSGHSGLGQFVENFLASYLPSDFICEDNCLLSGEEFVKQARNPVQNVLSELQGLGGDGYFKGLFDNFLCVHIYGLVVFSKP